MCLCGFYFKGSSRFSIQKRLDAGGFGVVYQAYDLEHNSVVALKTLHHANAKDLYRFKKEFRALADLVHPNLVALYELFSKQEQWFFTMEMISGNNFLEYVKATESTATSNSSSEMQTKDGLESLNKDDLNNLCIDLGDIYELSLRLPEYLKKERGRPICWLLADGRENHKGTKDTKLFFF